MSQDRPERARVTDRETQVSPHHLPTKQFLRRLVRCRYQAAVDNERGVFDRVEYGAREAVVVGHGANPNRLVEVALGRPSTHSPMGAERTYSEYQEDRIAPELQGHTIGTGKEVLVDALQYVPE